MAKQRPIPVAGLPSHLQVEGSPPFRCHRCGRGSWSASDEGKSCEMPQPSGEECDGVFLFRPAKKEPTP